MNQCDLLHASLVAPCRTAPCETSLLHSEIEASKPPRTRSCASHDRSREGGVAPQREPVREVRCFQFMPALSVLSAAATFWEAAGGPPEVFPPCRSLPPLQLGTRDPVRTFAVATYTCFCSAFAKGETTLTLKSLSAQSFSPNLPPSPPPTPAALGAVLCLYPCVSTSLAGARRRQRPRRSSTSFGTPT